MVKAFIFLASKMNCVLPLPAGRFSNAGIDWPFDASIIVEISASNNLETHKLAVIWRIILRDFWCDILRVRAK
jgi:hypothetical protein